MTSSRDERSWRISDHDRESAVEALGEHYATGRLDKGEYDERVGRAWSARTNVELTPLFSDLPGPHGGVVPVAQPVVQPAAPRTPQSGWQGPPWAGRRRGYGFPFPLLLLLVPLVVLLHAPFLLFFGLLWFGLVHRRRW